MSDRNEAGDNGVRAAAAPVLIVAPQPFFRPTGTPLNVLQMCRALTDGGYQVHLASFPHGDDVHLNGLRHHRCPAVPGIGAVAVGFSWPKLVYDAMLAGTVLRLLLRRRYVAVHALEEAAFFAVPLARLFRTPAIVDLDSELPALLQRHSSRLVRRLAGPAAVLQRWSLRAAACAVTVAPSLTAIVRRDSPRTPVFEIPDIPLDGTLTPADPAAVAVLAASLGPASRRWIVYTGNLDSRQGVAELVAALPRVAEDQPDAAVLVVGGEDDQVAALRRQAAELGVADRLVCVGRQPPERMPEYMALAAVLVSPRLEAFVTPLKVFSYMASGRPIVATDLPTHTAVLDKSCAVLVPPTPAGLAEGILRALARPKWSAALGAKARRRVLRDHSPERFRRQIQEAYAAVTKRAAAPAAVGARMASPAGQ